MIIRKILSLIGTPLEESQALHLLSFDKKPRLFFTDSFNIKEVDNSGLVDNNVVGISAFIESDLQTAKGTKYKSQVIVEKRWFQKLPIIIRNQ